MYRRQINLKYKYLPFFLLLVFFITCVSPNTTAQEKTKSIATQGKLFLHVLQAVMPPAPITEQLRGDGQEPD